MKSFAFPCFAALATACATAACSAPQKNMDGKPVAISPLSESGRDAKDKSTPVPERSVKPTSKGAPLTLKLLEKGTLDGRYVRERCSEGVREVTLLEKAEVTFIEEFFVAGACEVGTRTEKSTWSLEEPKEHDITLKATEKWITLRRAEDVENANAEDKATFLCATGWTLDVPRNVSDLGECKLEAPRFTRLSVEAGSLVWGVPGQSAKGALLDGTSKETRHQDLETIPYFKKPE